MKKNLRNNIALLLVFLLAAACQRQDHEAHAEIYLCPMHPTVVADQPGTCPVCGMDLVRQGRPGEEVQMTEELARLVKSPGESVVSSVKTIKGEYKTMTRTLTGQGMITYDPRYAFDVSVTTDGRIEKTFITYAMQPVKKGQAIAVIYSPALATAQRELLYILAQDAGNEAMIESAKEKLHLLDFSASQLDALIKSKEVNALVTLYSKYDGYVVSSTNGLKEPVAEQKSSMTSMSSPTQNSFQPPSALLREGDYVAAGQTLFKVASANALRVDVSFPASQTGLIVKGEKAHLDFGNGETHYATVDLVQPFFSEGQQFVNVRFYIPAMKDLHITHLVTATLQGSNTESLWVPRQAVVDLGTSEVIFVKDKGAFVPKRIVTGSHNGEWIEVKTGLASSEEIAAHAAYLVDSEGSVKPIN